MATTPLEQQLLARQQQPNPFKVGAGLAGDAGTVGKFLSKVPGQLGTFGTTLSKIIPYAGIATGLLGMAGNKGTISNILSGATTGASIGSIVPGLGTLVGGGIGALAGGVESLFNIGKPSTQELQGRQAQGSVASMLSGGATPEQMKEAQSAVSSGQWKDLNSPLSLIVMRDALSRSGNPNAEGQAEQWMNNLWKAEKQGPQAVQQASSPIASFFQTGHVAPPVAPRSTQPARPIPNHNDYQY